MMLQALASAAAMALVMSAVLLWRQAALPGRRELVVCLAAGALFFLVQGFRPALDFALPFVMLGPLACNLALRAGFEARPLPFWLMLPAGYMLFISGSKVGKENLGFVVWFNCIALLLFADAARVAWLSMPDDMVEARRRSRGWLLAAGAGLSLLIAVPSALGFGAWALPAGAVGTMALCLAMVAFGDRVAAAQAQDAALDSRDRALAQRLRALMVAEQLHRDPALTLSRLAQRLEVPEHRLRRVIHIVEGKRNFSAWLNALRIDDVKAGLDGEGTILKLALAAGYSSLSVFNRAFRESEGMTPTAWRAARRDMPRPARTAKTSASAANAVDAPSET